MRLLFLTIPKPLKQYTLFKKDDPLRATSRRLINTFLQMKLPGTSNNSEKKRQGVRRIR